MFYLSLRRTHGNGYKGELKKTELCIKTDEAKDLTLHKTRKVQNKSILKESKLKLKPDLKSLKHEKCSVKKREDIENGKSDCSKESWKKVGVKMQRSCSMEFRKATSTALADGSTLCNPVDEESDELAEYLEHVLFLPKPMSAMAEMMYG